MAEEQPYELEHREVVAEAPNLRVSILTLAAGQCVPWHYHSEIIDTFFCMEGPMVVQTQGGRNKKELAPGEHHTVPQRTAHYVSGKGGGRCRFMIVQGVGVYDYVPVDVPHAE